MTTRYRVEYALKVHRRDAFIEWIKGLLAPTFVLLSGFSNSLPANDELRKVDEATRRYAEIFGDLENLINEHFLLSRTQSSKMSRLKTLVPSIGIFFTLLPLKEAFYYQNARRCISTRRMVGPSFNDVRLILNSAQVLALSQPESRLKLVTFDGDVTLYIDGGNIESASPVIPQLVDLLRRDFYVGVVTAAGYSEKDGHRYIMRLKGLFDVLSSPNCSLSNEQKSRLLIMGGEASYLFAYNSAENRLNWVPKSYWQLEEAMCSDQDVVNLLDLAEQLFETLREKMHLPAKTIRKEFAVGLVPLPQMSICRELLEEVVLVIQRRLDHCEIENRPQFCAFNGGSDVWVDVGDKRLGVRSLQKYLGSISEQQTLHVGDQFLSQGANDYKARLAACTVWVASPQETVAVIKELCNNLDAQLDEAHANEFL